MNVVPKRKRKGVNKRKGMKGSIHKIEKENKKGKW